MIGVEYQQTLLLAYASQGMTHDKKYTGPVKRLIGIGLLAMSEIKKLHLVRSVHLGFSSDCYGLKSLKPHPVLSAWLCQARMDSYSPSFDESDWQLPETSQTTSLPSSGFMLDILGLQPLGRTTR